MVDAMTMAPNPLPHPPRRALDGVLLLDKDIGLSSNASLQRARRLFRADKAGHTGTLDPLASGLLPICFGQAAKFAHVLLEGDKTYAATIRLGLMTTTGDAEGDPIEQRPVRASRQEVDALLPRFTGAIAQVPPRHAALKYRGRKYYEYAREGIDIPRVARQIVVHHLALVEWDPPEFKIVVRCGKGTYIRALAEDIGAALGCGAHLAALRRLASGGFDVAAAHSLEALTVLDEAGRDAVLLPPDVLLATLPRLELDRIEGWRLSRGQTIDRRGLPDGDYRAYAGGSFIGVGRVCASVVRPRRLLAVEDAAAPRLVPAE